MLLQETQLHTGHLGAGWLQPPHCSPRRSNRKEGHIVLTLRMTDGDDDQRTAKRKINHGAPPAEDLYVFVEGKVILGSSLSRIVWPSFLPL